MRTLICLFALSLAGPALSADLLQIYRAAQDNDPNYAAARSTLEAGREKLPQGLAGLLPSLSASGNSSWNENELSSSLSPGSTHQNFNSNGYQLALSQPLFRWQNWVAYDQSKFQVAQAEANFAQARQDLILRVAQAYFDTLFAYENLSAVRANKEAISLQLESAKKNFEVGTATITDTHEAQARHDLAQAQEIAAESDLEVKQNTLQAIIGRPPGKLARLRKDAEASQPRPSDMNLWVAAAERDSISVQIQQAAAEIAEREVDRQRAGHYPTLDLVANVGYAKSSNQGGNLQENEYQNIGVQLNLPLYLGGQVNSRQREASANRAAAQSMLEAARRSAALAARQHYLGVANGLAQIHALKAALISSQSALESNKLGHEVGVRIMIDVLNAENQVYVTRRDLARSTFDTLLAQLQLKSAVGTLGDEDVVTLNTLLDPTTAQ
ncbi:MAG: TolC family outer membrane protein [Azonexus sp.]|jgi:outer membrane protein|uniref:TolC family outer membrane protein n=1 Tax=Azonexus sp. TaxID=1872668 RepID=UPI00282D5F73|nr:TolC family outer membrane protein [Azonexus sp.]MDR0776375.1 TolC family outer membrane protein [Azonexus sp.]